MKRLVSVPRGRLELKNCTFKIKDGGSNELEIKIGEGNFSWTENVERTYHPDRGVLDDVTDGDEQPMDVSFDFVYEYIRSTSTGSTPTITDALKQRGGAANWASSDSDVCRPYAVDIEITNTPRPGCGDTEVLTFPDFRYESLDHDMREGTVSCSGKCNAVEPSSSRS